MVGLREGIHIPLQHLVQTRLGVQLVLERAQALLVVVPDRLLPLEPGGLFAEQVLDLSAAEQSFNRDPQPFGDQGDVLVEEAGPSALERYDGGPADADFLCQFCLGEAGQLARPAQMDMEEVFLHGSKLFGVPGIPVPEISNYVQKF